MSNIPRHRCEDNACTYFGQPTDRGCLCHKTDEQMLIGQRDGLLAALVRISEDFVPDNAGQQAQAIEEMRECAHEALAKLGGAS